MTNLLENLKSYRVLLASKSPRRQQLLKDMGIDFKTISKETDESFPPHLKPEEIACFLSNKKSEAFLDSELPENFLIITADTIVVKGNDILNKAENYHQACKMLKLLSDATHQVVTGITIRSKNKSISFADKSDVKFKRLSQEEIDWYIEHYKPFDKAGSYGIQEWIGYIGISNIVGSFYNVMGLPTHLIYEKLKQF